MREPPPGKQSELLCSLQRAESWALPQAPQAAWNFCSQCLENAAGPVQLSDSQRWSHASQVPTNHTPESQLWAQPLKCLCFLPGASLHSRIRPCLPDHAWLGAQTPVPRRVWTLWGSSGHRPEGHSQQLGTPELQPAPPTPPICQSPA